MLKKENGATILKPMIYDERENLKHPIPRPMELSVVGKTLTQKEWTKFCASVKPKKLLHYCERKHDGSILFFGENGLDAAKMLHTKFKDRFHFALSCKNKILAMVSLGLCKERDIPVYEIKYQENNNTKCYVSNPEVTHFASAITANEILSMTNLKIA